MKFKFKVSLNAPSAILPSSFCEEISAHGKTKECALNYVTNYIKYRYPYLEPDKLNVEYIPSKEKEVKSLAKTKR